MDKIIKIFEMLGFVLVVNILKFFLKTIIAIINTRFYKVKHSSYIIDDIPQNLQISKIGIIDIFFLFIQGSFISKEIVNNSDLHRIKEKLDVL